MFKMFNSKLNSSDHKRFNQSPSVKCCCQQAPSHRFFLAVLWKISLLLDHASVKLSICLFSYRRLSNYTQCLVTELLLYQKKIFAISSMLSYYFYKDSCLVYVKLSFRETFLLQIALRIENTSPTWLSVNKICLVHEWYELSLFWIKKTLFIRQLRIQRYKNGH